MNTIKDFFDKRIPFQVSLSNKESSKTLLFVPVDDTFVARDKERVLAVYTSASDVIKALNMIPNYKVSNIQPIQESEIEL